jgi:hypothetical protein
MRLSKAKVSFTDFAKDIQSLPFGLNALSNITSKPIECVHVGFEIGHGAVIFLFRYRKSSSWFCESCRIDAGTALVASPGTIFAMSPLS